MYFATAAAVCLACLLGYMALPRLRQALLEQQPAVLGTKTAAELPLAQPIVGYHTSSELAEV